MPKAIISVSNKENIIPFAKKLCEHQWEILASGGTAKLLSEHQIPVIEISNYTGSPEILDGRVKTLHPAIHGGILAQNTPSHLADLDKLGFDFIDLVVCNLYPFQETIKKEGVSLEEVIENIDIGGVTLLRAAAKNYPRVSVLCDTADYDGFIDKMAQGTLQESDRYALAVKAFKHTAQYDAAIATHLSQGEFIGLSLHKQSTLRYGENPHQQASYLSYAPQTGPLGGKFLQGKELSYNNYLDLDAAWRAVVSFTDPSIVIIKHLSPCGIASAPTLCEAYANALASDPVSAYGSVIASNTVLDGKTAEAMRDLFVECIIAPAFSSEALKIYEAKKNCRLIQMPDLQVSPKHEFRSVNQGLLLQTIDLGDPQPETWNIVSKRQPTQEELTSLQFAWKACQHVKSNSIVFASSTATVGIGGGQPNRVDCVHIAAKHAGEKSIGAVMASDAFFPFSDSIEAAVKYGITAIIHPGGSKRDQESIDLADKHNMVMIMTGVRHFKH